MQETPTKTESRLIEDSIALEAPETSEVNESAVRAAAREKKAPKAIKELVRMGLYEVFCDACEKLDKLAQQGLEMPLELKISADIDLRPR